jgi:spore photoproduct lyase
MQSKLFLDEGINIGDIQLLLDMPSVKFERYQLLDGNEKSLVQQVGDGSIIVRFDKTPPPSEKTDIVCPHFLEFKWANGCNFDCAWCYLNGTFRFRREKKTPYLKDKKRIIQHLDSFFINSDGNQELLNSGELSDSLVFEGNGFSLGMDIIPLFKRYRKHKLLILTKSANVNNILESDSQDVVIASFSVNAHSVAERWEHKAPHLKKRLQAAKRLSEAGYEVRLRIDPMVPVDDWEKQYLLLIDDIFESFTPDRITIGSLRGLHSTITHCSDRSWLQYLDDNTSNWGRKINSKLRYEMYRTLIDYLMQKYDYSAVGLCKETIEMWDLLKMDYRTIQCNCTL